MKRMSLIAGVLVVVASWSLASTHAGMTGHMTAHMAVVAVASPLMAIGLRGGAVDLALRWPRIVTPLLMSVLEMLVVWGWHMPAARAFAASGVAGLALEQAMFLAAGLLLWSACLGAGEAVNLARRASGILAVLLTTMHMTLLGVLIALAPRTLYGTSGVDLPGLALTPLHDQQVGGVVMLLVGGGSYLLGGLVLLRRVIDGDVREPAPR
jgi:putative membrane protein